VPEFPTLSRFTAAGWVVFFAGSFLLCGAAVQWGETAPLVFLLCVLAAAALVSAVPGPTLGRRRAVVGLFLLALGVRLVAAFVFDRIGEGVGDPFSGSSDAWAYDQWARRLTDAWSQGEWLSLERWDQAGRWDVGFHYVLAGVYSVFGQSVLLGRALVAVFGALAVVFFLEIAMRLTARRIAEVIAIVYAFWPTSVAWNGYSLLRDAFVWAVLLLTVWLGLVVAGGRLTATPLFATALIALRLARPYAFGAVVIGLLVAGAVAVWRRRKTAIVPALAVAAALIATEAFFLFIGFPNIAGMAVGYAPRRVMFQNVDKSPASPKQALHYRPPGPPQRLEPPEEPDQFRPPKRLFGPSLPANAARFLINPPAWAPVEGDIRYSDNWQLPGMWVWYLALPLAGFGFWRGLASKGPVRIVFAATLLFVLFLVLAGRGDFARQREMVVPIFLLAAAIGATVAAERPRLLAWTYAIYFVCFAGGIAYHRHTLRERGLAGLCPPRVSRFELPKEVC
jgi:hypothetical protein